MLLKNTPEDFIVAEVLAYALDDAGQHSLYVLRKRGWNTEDCLQWLSKALRIPRKDLGYCGNKDKRAVTTQHITMLRGPKEVRTPDGFSLTYVGRVKDKAHLGDHQGNEFTIVVRDLPQGTKTPTLKPIKNLFGEQRFGENNADVGFALVRKQYQQACALLGLEAGTDPIGALRKLPKHTLLLYVHACQSALWNEFAQGLPGTEQRDVPIPGFNPSGDESLLPALDTLLTAHGLSRMDFVDRSFPELSSEGGSRKLLQDVTAFHASDVRAGACTVTFSLPPGSYATETVKQLFS